MGSYGRFLLLHKFIDGLAQIIDGVCIAGGNGIHHAVAHMILQDDLAGIIQRGADCCQLDKDFRTILPFFYHPLHLFEMADGPGQTVDYRFLIFMNMSMRMGDTVGMQISVVMFLLLIVSGGVFQSGSSFNGNFVILYFHFSLTASTPGGYFRKNKCFDILPPCGYNIEKIKRSDHHAYRS